MGEFNLKKYHFIPGFGLYKWLKETETGERRFMNAPEYLTMSFYHIATLTPIYLATWELGEYVLNLIK